MIYPDFMRILNQFSLNLKMIKMAATTVLLFGSITIQQINIKKITEKVFDIVFSLKCEKNVIYTVR